MSATPVRRPLSPAGRRACFKATVRGPGPLRLWECCYDSYGHSENRPRVLTAAVLGTERGRLVLVVRLVEHPCGRRVA